MKLLIDDPDKLGYMDCACKVAETLREILLDPHKGDDLILKEDDEGYIIRRDGIDYFVPLCEWQEMGFLLVGQELRKGAL